MNVNSTNKLIYSSFFAMELKGIIFFNLEAPFVATSNTMTAATVTLHAMEKGSQTPEASTSSATATTAGHANLDISSSAKGTFQSLNK